MTRPNQRHTPRIVCEVPARAEGPRGPLRGLCRSISQSGLFFSAAAATFPIGSSVEVSVELPVGVVSALGEVRYHHASREGGGVGLKFTRLSGVDLAAIQRFIEAHGGS